MEQRFRKSCRSIALRTYIERGASHIVITIVTRVRYSVGFLILGSIISLSSVPAVAAQTPNANNSSSETDRHRGPFGRRSHRQFRQFQFSTP
jgi:hypothetical protein